MTKGQNEVTNARRTRWAWIALALAALAGCGPAFSVHSVRNPPASLPKGRNEVVVPVEKGLDLLFVAVRVNRLSAGYFHVDTGAPGNLIDQSVANRLLLPRGPAGRISGVGGSGGSIRARRVLRLSVGKMTLGGHWVVGYDLQMLRKATAADVRGLLGGALWSRLPFTIDHRANTITFYRRETFRPPEGAAELALRIMDNKPHVKGSLNGRAEGWFLLDTGHSGSTVVRSEFLKQHEISAPVRYCTVSTGVGGRVKREKVELESLKVFGRTFPKAAVNIDPGGGEVIGTIGSAVLREFRLTFDYAAGKMWAEHRPLEPVAEMLARGADLEAKDFLGHTALSLAAYHYDPDRVKALIEAGAELDPRSKRQHTPLLMAAIAGSVKAALVLIENGADANAVDKEGVAPLHCAVFGGNLELVNALLAAGANANLKNKAGWTPLWLAKQAGHKEIVEILREAGATK